MIAASSAMGRRNRAGLMPQALMTVISLSRLQRPSTISMATYSTSGRMMSMLVINLRNSNCMTLSRGMTPSAAWRSTATRRMTRNMDRRTSATAPLVCRVSRIMARLRITGHAAGAARCAVGADWRTSMASTGSGLLQLLGIVTAGGDACRPWTGTDAAGCVVYQRVARTRNPRGIPLPRHLCRRSPVLGNATAPVIVSRQFNDAPAHRRAQAAQESRIMKYTVKSTDPLSQSAACLAGTLYDDGRPGEPAAGADEATSGALGRAVKRGDIGGKVGDTLVIPGSGELRAERILLVGLGSRTTPLTLANLVKIGRSIVGAVEKLGVTDLSLALDALAIGERSNADSVAVLVEAMDY